MRYLILTSPTTSKNVSQSSIFYLKSFLLKKGIKFDIVDLSGAIDFYDPPSGMLGTKLWRAEQLFNENWIDSHIPECEKEYDYIYASALFSMDIVLQGRYVKRCKEIYPEMKAMIGGPAVRLLNSDQRYVISSVFDKISTEYLSVEPNYDSGQYGLKEFVTVATGTGCNWGKCRFCNSGREDYSLKNLDAIAAELSYIAMVSDSEVMLSSDSIPISKINELSTKLINKGYDQKYNLMMRADEKVDRTFSENLKESGCSDVFVGGEILDDTGLQTVNKGITVDAIKNTVGNLSAAEIDVQLGLILFLPCISEGQLKNQLYNLEELLPYINRIELESLSVLYSSDFYKKHVSYGIDLYPKKNAIFPAWCYGLSPDIPWGFKDDNNYLMWEKHIDSLRQVLNGYVDEKYWWHVDYIKENWK